MEETLIQSQLESLKANVETELQAIVRHSLDHELGKCVQYVLVSPGKRIRPLLLLTINMEIGGESDLTAIATAIELLHCASLIHDDLPALDNDDYRRGVPSAHKAFTEATAILAGDYLIAKCFEQCVKASIEPTDQSYVTSVLAQAFCELCHGQQLDLCAGEKDIIELYRKKTGALFAASTVLGLAGTKFLNDLTLRKAAHEMGESLGLLFQICDDLKDMGDCQMEKGRPQNSDKANKKNTLIRVTNRELVLNRIEQIKDVMFANLHELESSTARNFRTTRFLIDRTLSISQLNKRIESLALSI